MLDLTDFKEWVKLKVLNDNYKASSCAQLCLQHVKKHFWPEFLSNLDPSHSPAHTHNAASHQGFAGSAPCPPNRPTTPHLLFVCWCHCCKMLRHNFSCSETQSSVSETWIKSKKFKIQKRQQTHTHTHADFGTETLVSKQPETGETLVTQATGVLWLFTVHGFCYIRWHYPTSSWAANKRAG